MANEKAKPTFGVRAKTERAKDDPYSYDNSWILANKFNIENKEELDALEATLTTIRAREGIPKGNFDYKHLKDIHGHLFGDLYDWAGQQRTIEISKMSNDRTFTPKDQVEKKLNDTFEKLKDDNYLKDLSQDKFAKKIGDLINDINEAHPFREGNGRTMREFVTAVSNEAGYEINWSSMNKQEWNQASKDGFEGNPKPMHDLMKKSVVTIEQASDPVNKINSSGRSMYSAAQLRALYPDMAQLANRLEAQEAANNATDEQRAAMYAFQKANSNQLPRDKALQKYPGLDKHFEYWDKSVTLAKDRFKDGSREQTVFLIRMKDNISKGIYKDNALDRRSNKEAGGEVER